MDELGNQEKDVKHLEMIETIVYRLTTTSSVIKGWMITLIIGIVSVFHSSVGHILAITIPITVMLAFLNAYYFCIERKYRYLYDQVRVQKTKDFSIRHLMFEYLIDSATV
jgi:hypothetical protein